MPDLAPTGYEVIQTVIVVASIIYSAGVIKGSLSERIRDLDRRLERLEYALSRAGLQLLSPPLRRVGDEDR